MQELRRSRREFQGHFEVRVRGAWEEGPAGVPAGALWIPAGQRLARVAAQLLEPQSEDSFTTWNGFDAQLAEGELHPVLRVEP